MNSDPGRVPILLGSEPSRGWMLMLDAGSQLERNISSELKTEVIKVFGSIQLDSINYLNQFLDLGCEDRRPYHLISHIPSFIEDRFVISELTEEEITELRQKIPTRV